MRILLLAPQPFFQVRGTPIAVRRVAEVLGEAGHSIELLTFHEGDDLSIENCTIHRISRPPWVDNVPPGFSIRKVICDFFLLLKANALCNARSFDVVHAVEESVFVAKMLKSRFRVPYLYDMDSSLPEQLHDRFRWLGPLLLPLRWMERKAITGSHGVIAVCQSLENIVQLVSPNTPVLRMEDTSPHSMTDAESDSPISLPNISHPIILYVGNLQAYQGIELLLESFQLVSTNNASATLVIVGGSDKSIQKYRERAARLRLSDRVIFAGIQPLEAIPHYLNLADLVVSPRIQGTNTPMKIYSYMESRTPLVATRLPTHTQVLNDSMCWLSDPTPAAFGAEIANALTNSTRSKELAANAQEYAELEFNSEIQDEKLRLFYEDVEYRLNREHGRLTVKSSTAIPCIREGAPQ